MKHQNITDESGGDLTGAARWRHLKREAAAHLLMNIDRQDAAVICATVLDEIGAGAPPLDYWTHVRDAAEEWAFFANAAELESYFSSAVKRLENQALGLKARKRMFAALWLSFSEADRRAFLARVDADGVFHGRAEA